MKDSLIGSIWIGIHQNHITTATHKHEHAVSVRFFLKTKDVFWERKVLSTESRPSKLNPFRTMWGKLQLSTPGSLKNPGLISRPLGSVRVARKERCLATRGSFGLFFLASRFSDHRWVNFPAVSWFITLLLEGNTLPPTIMEAEGGSLQCSVSLHLSRTFSTEPMILGEKDIP